MEPAERSSFAIGVGDVVRDVALVDHEANPWRFSDHRGRTLVLILHRHLA